MALKVVCVLVMYSQPSVQIQAGCLCLETLSVSLGPRTAGAHHWLLWEVDEAGVAPQGPWVARGEAALMCQSLSPEVPEPRGVRHFLARQSFGAVGSSCRASPCVCYTPASERGPTVHLSPVRHTAGEPESVHQHEHAYTCL